MLANVLLVNKISFSQSAVVLLSKSIHPGLFPASAETCKTKPLFVQKSSKCGKCIIKSLKIGCCLWKDGTLFNNLIEFDFGFKSFKNRLAYNTRNKQNLAFELSKTNWGFFKTVPHCGKDWNTIDLETRNADNLIAFKKSIVKNNLLYIILDILIIYLFIFFDI